EAVTGADATPAAPAGLPEPDQFLPPAIAALGVQRDQAAELADQTRAYGRSEVANPNAGALARAAADRAASLRDGLAVALETLERLPRLDTLRVARALATGQSLPVIGPPRT